MDLRPRLMQTALLAYGLACPLGAHPRPFPLAPPTAARHPLAPVQGRPAGAAAALADPRLRAVEAAVLQAGGWSRWRRLDRLYLRLHRRRLDPLGRVVSHREESVVLGREELERYWEEDGILHHASLHGRRLTLHAPERAEGDPRAVAIRQELAREQFWQAHPFLLYRAGLETRYLGTTVRRGVRGAMLEARFAPGASPYAKVHYFFDNLRGDLLEATAWSAHPDAPVETWSFSGRAPGPTGLRLPLRRELRVDGVVQEVVTTLDLATRPRTLPPAPVSAEARAVASRAPHPPVPRPGS